MNASPESLFLVVLRFGSITRLCSGVQLDGSENSVSKRVRATCSSKVKRKRLRTAGAQDSEQESNGVSLVECIDVHDDRDLSGVSGKKCKSSRFLKSIKDEKRSSMSVDHAEKAESKMDDLRMNIKEECNLIEDEGDLKIICEVFNAPNAKFVKIEGDGEHAHILKKGMDVLKFVEGKKHEASNESFVYDNSLSKQDNNVVDDDNDIVVDDRNDDKRKKGRDDVRVSHSGKEKVGDKVVKDQQMNGNRKRGSFSDNESDNRSGTSKKERNVGIKIKESSVKSELKSADSQGVAKHVRSSSVNKTGTMNINPINIINPLPPAEFDEMSFSSKSGDDDNESCAEYVCKESAENQIIPMTTGKNTDKVVALNAKNVSQILANSLLDVGEDQLENFAASHGIEPVKEISVYKFRFTDEDSKPVEKSEFEKEVDRLFAEMDMHLTSEQIGSAPLEDVDNGALIRTQTGGATLCSQGIHHLVFKEEVGTVCKFCSHVEREIRYILPPLSKPSSRRRDKSSGVEAECPFSLDHFQVTGAENHASESYRTSGTVWDLIPGTRNTMYEHQREGFEFIWKNIAGGTVIEKLQKPLSSSGSGCIISHAPGTGKTRLTLIFLQSFMKMYPDSRPVIIAPKSLLLTWEEEFKKWNVNIPFHNLNNLEFSGQENAAAIGLSKKGRGSKNNETITRLVKLFSWKLDKSILGITYGLFEKLVGAETRKVGDCNPVVQQMGKSLLKLPTLLVLDEGHTPRNNGSYLYRSLFEVETDRRIILSGTPFQNNFKELYNTLRLVNPKFCKTTKSEWASLTKKLKLLKETISPFVHVHKGRILQENCPGLNDAMILLRPTDLQKMLIDLLADLVKPKDQRNNYLQFSHVMSVVSVHPSLLPDCWFQEQQFSAYKDRLEKLKKDPYSGAKTKFVIELCRLSEALNEKVLIFSQFIDPLIFIKEQLQTQYKWLEGREVLYMHGSLEPKQRQSLITALNDPKSKVRVLLASIKACSEGIHLVGASRVVFLDVVWNPSVERQAISRAYRIGQKKIVYTYHLIAGKMEVDKYKRQIQKDRFSDMVFSSKDGMVCKENIPDKVFEDKILEEMFQRNDKLGGMFEKILYQPRESNLVDTFDLVEN
ncbi:SNF2 domain-containing protein CLASSY 3-like [Apium graveolens]|uniref:SNF2 domain-containing protein CLASSY 3-like n=1 Tax=Apium graveolens TaxID=4045 RepID=UPI003D7B4C54